MQDTEPVTAETSDEWRTVGVIASLAVAVVGIGFQTIVGVIPPVAVLAVLSLVSAGLFRWVGSRWVGLVPVIANVVIVGGSTRFLLDDWSHPEDAASFVFSTVAAGGAILATAAGIAVLARRSDGAARPLMYGIGTVATIAIAFSLVSAATLGDVAPEASDLRVETRNIDFAPDEMTLGPEHDGVWIENQDAVRHTFTIAGTGLSVDIPSNGTARLDVDLDPGTYDVICAIEGHESMGATLVVEGG